MAFAMVDLARAVSSPRTQGYRVRVSKTSNPPGSRTVATGTSPVGADRVTRRAGPTRPTAASRACHQPNRPSHLHHKVKGRCLACPPHPRSPPVLPAAPITEESAAYAGTNPSPEYAHRVGREDAHPLERQSHCVMIAGRAHRAISALLKNRYRRYGCGRSVQRSGRAGSHIRCRPVCGLAFERRAGLPDLAVAWLVRGAMMTDP